MTNKATTGHPVILSAMRSLAMPLLGHVLGPIMQTPDRKEYVPEIGEPSLFTRGEGAVHPRWVRWFMIKHGLSHAMAMNIGTALYSHLTREPLRDIDPDSDHPPVSVPNEALVSMAFVMDYRHRYGVSFQVAYTMGYADLFGRKKDWGQHVLDKEHVVAQAS